MEDEHSVTSKSPHVVSFSISALLLLGSACGGWILAWWFLSFHRENERLWMVPLGLVIFCAPLLACLSISFSPGSCRRFILSSSAMPPPPPQPTADLERH
ncbi:hypothetical protein KSP40_PGU018782 [Platanthera guangdongensis]|uniref:Transmembrane protein n=1 Tax=Platanthera guangdongensis TaxID=2320717 RepID=A0ABR2MH44_9ASPA